MVAILVDDNRIAFEWPIISRTVHIRWLQQSRSLSSYIEDPRTLLIEPIKCFDSVAFNTLPFTQESIRPNALLGRTLTQRLMGTRAIKCVSSVVTILLCRTPHHYFSRGRGCEQGIEKLEKQKLRRK